MTGDHGHGGWEGTRHGGLQTNLKPRLKATKCEKSTCPGRSLTTRISASEAQSKPAPSAASVLSTATSGLHLTCRQTGGF